MAQAVWARSVCRCGERTLFGTLVVSHEARLHSVTHRRLWRLRVLRDGRIHKLQAHSTQRAGETRASKAHWGLRGPGEPGAFLGPANDNTCPACQNTMAKKMK